MGCAAGTAVPEPHEREADLIDVREFAEGDKMLYLMADNHEMIKDMFKQFDGNNSKKLSSPELRGFVKTIVPRQYKNNAEEHNKLIDKHVEKAFSKDDHGKIISHHVDIFAFSYWLQTALVARFLSLKPEGGRRLTIKQMERFLRALTGKDQGTAMSFQELQFAMQFIEKNADNDISVSRFVHICLQLMRMHMNGVFDAGNKLKSKMKGRRGGNRTPEAKYNDKNFEGSWIAHIVNFNVSERAWNSAAARVKMAAVEKKFYREENTRKLMKLKEEKSAPSPPVEKKEGKKKKLSAAEMMEALRPKTF